MYDQLVKIASAHLASNYEEVILESENKSAIHTGCTLVAATKRITTTQK